MILLHQLIMVLIQALLRLLEHLLAVALRFGLVIVIIIMCPNSTWSVKL